MDSNRWREIIWPITSTTSVSHQNHRQEDIVIMATQLWANRDPSWKSTDSSESSETYLNLNQLCRNYSISSSYSQDQCLKGHNLILVPVTCERNTICGTCCAYIKIKPVQILCYHCEECNLDSCSQCVSEVMRETLMNERSRATVSLQCRRLAQSFGAPHRVIGHIPLYLH